MNGARKEHKLIGTAAPRWPSAFTLLEVMVALGVVAIAMLALLALHHQNLINVLRGQEISRAAMLGQVLMTQAELERFPEQGTTRGDFKGMFAQNYPNYRWERVVAPSALFPDLVKVTVKILYGPGFGHTFELVEFLHNPRPTLTIGPSTLQSAQQPGGR